MEKQVLELCRQLQKDNWRPDYIVGLVRGGLVPATIMSQYLECPLNTLLVSLRDGGECETNTWMPEDAYGETGQKKNILIVDDINDSGATLNWIMKDWQSNCVPDGNWNSIWNENVRVATLVNNVASQSLLRVNYTAMEINKRQKDVWIEFPWENWWKNETKSK